MPLIIYARTFVINILFLPVYICDVSLNITLEMLAAV